MRSTEERLAGYEQDLFDVREQLEAITQVVALETFGELTWNWNGCGTWEFGWKTIRNSMLVGNKVDDDDDDDDDDVIDFTDDHDEEKERGGKE